MSFLFLFDGKESNKISFSTLQNILSVAMYYVEKLKIINLDHIQQTIDKEMLVSYPLDLILLVLFVCGTLDDLQRLLDFSRCIKVFVVVLLSIPYPSTRNGWKTIYAVPSYHKIDISLQSV